MAKKSGFIQEFKAFISRGSVMDLAVGIIIGTAFTAIVNSLVKDIIMPIVGWVLGGVNFVDLRIVIRKATLESTELALTYGNFIQKVIDFLIIAFVVFMIVRTLNKLRALREKAAAEEAAKAAPAPAPVPVVPADVVLLTEIRDLLKKN
ncbi:MAG: large-conductance mechanosensitive channel protein MscL [Sphaerochaetaceae bacterium]|jgi:large conductance mechanosensitive channel|nr:large-conductance mechanosensitive channel protein MscL [Sphaerochaetaceae bacterium]